MRYNSLESLFHVIGDFYGLRFPDYFNVICADAILNRPANDRMTTPSVATNRN